MSAAAADSGKHEAMQKARSEPSGPLSDSSSELLGAKPDVAGQRLVSALARERDAKPGVVHFRTQRQHAGAGGIQHGELDGANETRVKRSNVLPVHLHHL